MIFLWSESPTEPLDRLDEALITSAEAVTGNDVHDVHDIHDVSNEKIDLTESMPLEATNNEEETRYIVKAVPMTSIKNEQKSLDENNLPPTPSSLPSSPEHPQEPLNEVIIDETVITPDLNNSSAIASSMGFFQIENF